MPASATLPSPLPRPVARRSAAQPKGRQTKQAIVEAALNVAKQLGLEGLSIGTLADATGMSKSGVFAHFGSRDELQISVIQAYFAEFRREVFLPCLRVARGLPRLRAMFANWMRQVTVTGPQGCLFISGAVDFDDRPGPVRDALLESMRIWFDAVEQAIRLAKQEGHLRADAPEAQIMFEMHGLILALHFEVRFMHKPQMPARAQTGFDQMLARYLSPTAPVVRAG